MPYTIQHKQICDNCGGAGKFYEEDFNLPFAFISYSCPRCDGGIQLSEISADEWLVDRLKKLHRRVDRNDLSELVEWPFRDAELEFIN